MLVPGRRVGGGQGGASSQDPCAAACAPEQPPARAFILFPQRALFLQNLTPPSPSARTEPLPPPRAVHAAGSRVGAAGEPLAQLVQEEAVRSWFCWSGSAAQFLDCGSNEGAATTVCLFVIQGLFIIIIIVVDHLVSPREEGCGVAGSADWTGITGAEVSSNLRLTGRFRADEHNKHEQQTTTVRLCLLQEPQ